MAAIPFPGGQFFQIHGSKFKLHPVCYLSQASVLRVTHTVLLLRIGEHTLNLLFSQTVQLFVYRHMADMLRHLHIVLPNMAQDCFLTLGIFSTHSSAGTAFAKIGPAFVFPITVPVCGGIMQRTVLRADHIIKVFVIHIRPPGMAVLFAFGTGITSGKNAAALEDSLADPGRFVGAVCYNGFVFGVVSAQFIIQRIKRDTVVDIAGSDVNTKNKIVFVAGGVCFVSKTFFGPMSILWTKKVEILC